MHHHNRAYPKFPNKNIILILNVNSRFFWTIVLFFVDASKDQTMVDDALRLHLFWLQQYKMKSLKKH
jgi:hypothetical protein